MGKLRMNTRRHLKAKREDDARDHQLTIIAKRGGRPIPSKAKRNGYRPDVPALSMKGEWR